MTAPILRRVRRARRAGSLLLTLGLLFSAVEAAWAGEPRVAEPAPVAVESAAQAPGDAQESPLRHAGHDADCACLCAGPCPGAMGAVFPMVTLSEASDEAISRTLPGRDRMPATTAPAPLLRPPLQ